MGEVFKVSLFCTLNLCIGGGGMSASRSVTEQLVKTEMSLPGIQHRSFRDYCANLLIEISAHHCLLLTHKHSFIIPN